MSHLTSSLKYGAQQSSAKLVSHESHLLIVSKNRIWTNQTFVVTPSKERFTSVAAYAKYGTGETSKIGQRMNVSDGASLISQVQSKFDEKTVTSWETGHKASFMYWNRGWYFQTPWLYVNSIDPWWAKTSGVRDEQEGARTFGCGGSWSALFFNLYGLPLKKASSSHVYLRFYNPSWMVLDWDASMPTQRYEYRALLAPASSLTVGNGATVMQYNIFGDLPKVQDIDTSDSESVKINFADANISNQGNVGSSFKVPMWDVETSESGANFGFYDPWNNRAELAQMTNVLNATPYYHPTNSTSDYYKDVEITTAVKNKLFDLMQQGYGGFWLLVGPIIKNYYTSNLYPGNCAMMYFSRVELVLNLTMTTFNT